MIITGTGFGDGATVTLGGTAATGVVVDSSTQITCVTPAHASGLVNVSVINADLQSATLTNAFRYIPPVWIYGDDDSTVPDKLAVSDAAPGPSSDWDETSEHSPEVYFISPYEGNIDGSGSDGKPLRVNIGGYWFINGATVTIGGGAALAVEVIDDKTITCFIPTYATGGEDVDVVVTNPDSGSGITRVATLTDGFYYLDGTADNPTASVVGVTQVIAAEGSTAGGTSVTVQGSNFTAGSTVSFGGIYATGVTVVSGQVITCTTPAHYKGVVDVRVDTP